MQYKYTSPVKIISFNGEEIEVPKSGQQFFQSLKNGLSNTQLVTIIGPTRSGKSFISNYLLGKQGYFDVGNRGSVTIGADIAADSVTWKDLATRFSTNYSSPNLQNMKFHFIDCEGSGDKDGVYDAKLASCMIMLSHTTIFNFKGDIGKTKILDGLAVLHQIVSSFTVNNETNNSNNNNTGKKKLGNIVFLFRDWTNLRTAQDVYDEIFGLEPVPEKNNSKVIERNEFRKNLQACFSSIKVHLLPECASFDVIRKTESVEFKDVKPEFHSGVSDLVKTLGENSNSVSIFGEKLLNSMTGGQILKTVISLCAELNHNEYVKYASFLQVVAKLEMEAAKEKCKTDFIEQTNSIQLPWIPDALTSSLENKKKLSLEAFLSRFSSTTSDNDGDSDLMAAELEEDLSKQITLITLQNNDALKSLLTSRSMQAALTVEAAIKSLVQRIQSSQLQKAAASHEIQLLKESSMKELISSCYSGDNCLVATEKNNQKIPDIESYISTYLEPKITQCQQVIEKEFSLLQQKESHDALRLPDSILATCVKEFEKAANGFNPCTSAQVEELAVTWLKKAKESLSSSLSKFTLVDATTRETCEQQLVRGIEVAKKSILTEQSLKLTNFVNESYKQQIADFSQATAAVHKQFQAESDKKAARDSCVSKLSGLKQTAINSYSRLLPATVPEREKYISAFTQEVSKTEKSQVAIWESEYTQYVKTQELTAQMERLRIEREREQRAREQERENWERQQQMMQMQQMMQANMYYGGGGYGGGGYSSGGSSPSRSSSSSGSPSRQLITGPRGGTYYINSNGNKTYVKR